MTEALKLLIISVCLNCGDGSEKLEYIKFYSDYLVIGEQRWNITKSSTLDTYGDKIYTGFFEITRAGETATITVSGSTVLFTIPKQKINVALYQIPHDSENYPPGEL